MTDNRWDRACIRDQISSVKVDCCFPCPYHYYYHYLLLYFSSTYLSQYQTYIHSLDHLPTTNKTYPACMLCRLVSSMHCTIITASYSMTPKPTLYSQHVAVVNCTLSPVLTKDISRQQLWPWNLCQAMSNMLRLSLAISNQQIVSWCEVCWIDTIWSMMEEDF